MFWLRMTRPRDREHMAVIAPIAGTGLTMLASQGAVSAAGPTLWALGLFFLKIGAILYGSGYLLIAFLEEELVLGYAWLTQEQLLEAIAIGQFTPGPVLSTAAFIGYLVTGGKLSGALVAAGAIFLPSFIFVAALNPLLPRLRESEWVASFLDAVNVCAVGLMAAVTIELGYLTLDSIPKMAIAGIASILILWRGVGAVWLVVGGAVVVGSSSPRAFRDEPGIPQTRSRLPARAPGPDRPHGRRRIYHRPASKPLSRILRRILRIPSIHARGLTARPGLESIWQNRPPLRQTIRRRNQPQIPSPHRRQCLNGIRLGRHHQIPIRILYRSRPIPPHVAPARRRRTNRF